MTTDRLQQLYELAKLPLLKKDEQPPRRPSPWVKASQARALANDIEQLLAEQSRLLQHYRKATKAEDLARTEMQQKHVSSKLNKLFQAFKGKLDQIKQQAEAAKQAAGEYSPEARELQQQFAGLSQILRENILAASSQADKFRAQMRGKTMRQLQILDPSLDERQREELLDCPQAIDRKLLEKTLGKASLRLQYKVEDINQKKAQMVRLQEATAQMKQMLTEIAFLVAQDSERIERISGLLGKAGDYLKKAGAELESQKEKSVGGRKRVCCILLVGLLILALVTVPVVLTFTVKQAPANATAARL